MNNHKIHTALAQRPFIPFLITAAALLSCAAFPFVRQVFSMARHNQTMSHIQLIPFISLFFLFTERKAVFSRVSNAFVGGGCITIAGITLLLVGRYLLFDVNDTDYLRWMMCSLAVVFLGCFMLVFGRNAFFRSRFPLYLLIFTIPIPAIVLSSAVNVLQHGSAEFVHAIFQVTGVTFLRQGTTFHLPQLSFDVAPQCSGIRSSIALFITGLIGGFMFLRTQLTRILLLCTVVPITMLKNAVRISVLTLGGSYINKQIMESDLHRRGGILFFLIAVVLLGCVALLCRKGERMMDIRLRRTTARQGEQGTRNIEGRKKE